MRALRKALQDRPIRWKPLLAWAGLFAILYVAGLFIPEGFDWVHFFGQGIGAVLQGTSQAIVKTHGSFQDRYILAGGIFSKQPAYILRPYQEKIQVPGFRTDNQTVKHGVDVVRTALKSRHLKFFVLQGPEDSTGNCSLTTAALRRR